MRYPAVAGTFYNVDKLTLSAEINQLLKNASEERTKQGQLDVPVKNIAGIVVPHGRYEYSADVAAAAYAAIKSAPQFTTFVIIGTDHVGRDKAVSMSREDWVTPLGVVPNDRELGDAIKKNSSFIDYDEAAHEYEPAIEVQLPFLQTIFGKPKVVEISVATHSDEVAKDLAKAILTARKDVGRSVMLIATTDMTVDQKDIDPKQNDEKAIKLIEEGKAEGLLDLIESGQASMCGPAVAATALYYAKPLEAKARLLKYKTVQKEADIINGYASFLLHR